MTRHRSRASGNFHADLPALEGRHRPSSADETPVASRDDEEFPIRIEHLME
jgi:hypothetical protein